MLGILGGCLAGIFFEVLVEVVETAVTDLEGDLLDTAPMDLQQTAGIFNADLVDVGDDGGAGVLLKSRAMWLGVLYVSAASVFSSMLSR